MGKLIKGFDSRFSAEIIGKSCKYQHTSVKIIQKAAWVMLVILAHTGCSSDRFLNKQQQHATDQGQMEIRTQEQKVITLHSSGIIKDSIDQNYQISIFPMDTFQFSVAEGFKGKASKIELQGKYSFVKYVQDSLSLSGAVQKSLKGRMIRKVEHSELQKTSAKRRKAFTWWQLGSEAAVLFFLVWIFRKSRKHYPT